MATSYDGGAGGKLRRKTLRNKQSTPYDRPATVALRRNPSWVSKMIVDPAYKLVDAGAQFFFSSLFRKRLTAGTNQESRDTFQDTVILSPAGEQRLTLNDHGKQYIHEDQGLEIKDSGKQMTTIDNGGLSELELMLKQKTFTRSEIDHLTEILHSRTVESSNGDGERISDFRFKETESTLQGHDGYARSSLQETRNESNLDNHRFHGRVPTPVVSSEILEEDVATPAEIAKAYMGNRSSKVSPSVLRLHSQAIGEDSVALCISPFTQRSPVISLVQKPSIHDGVLENGFMTPRSRGRSAIYSMTRTPYSRNHPTVSYKGNSSIYEGYGGPSASPSTGFAREFVSRSVSKDLALKRRSSVLEDEIGSVGPIRRLRQKTNLSTPKNMTLPIARTPFTSRGTGIATNGTLDPSSSSKTFHSSKDKENMLGTSYTPVPSQSRETARKILLQLEKLAPKEKQMEDKVGALSESSPRKLMPNMLHGQALRSLEDLDSSKILQSAGYSLNSKHGASSSQKQDKVEENGRSSSNVSHGSLAPVSNTVKFEDSVKPFSFSDSAKKHATQSSQKKWGFQMSAQEDFLGVDNEIHSIEASASANLAERKKELVTIAVDSKAVPVTEEKTSVSGFAPVVSSEFGKQTDLGTDDGTEVVEKSSGFILPAASTSFPPVISVSRSTAFTNDTLDKEPNAPPPLFSSGTKLDDKVSPFTFSSSTFVSGSLGLKSTAATEVKQETANSLAANASDATEILPKPADSINSGVGNTQKPDDTVGEPERLFSLPQSTSASTSSLFTFNSKPSFSCFSNGSLNTTPSVFSSPLPVLQTSNSENQTLPKPFISFPFSTTNSPAVSSEATPSTSATSSSLSAPLFNFVSTSNSTPSTATTTTPPPSFPPTPDFKSGSSFMAPSTSSAVSTTSSATDVKASNDKETSIANLPSNNPFSSPSFQMAGTGSSIFGFSAGSTSLSTAASSGTSISTQSVSMFGSSAPSSTFATSGSTPFTTGSSLQSLNTPSSIFGFGNNNTSSSYLFSSSTPNNSPFDLSNPASSLTGFSFSAQSPAFGPSSGAMLSPSLFSFTSASPTHHVFSPVPGGNNSDQNIMAEDSMAEDLVQVGPTSTLTPTPSFPVFSQAPVSNPSPSPFMFASTLPSSSSGVNPFQFGGQQSQPIVQNPNPFQESGSQDFSGGGNSFSLGSGGGGEKSARKFVRVKRRNGKK